MSCGFLFLSLSPLQSANHMTRTFSSMRSAWFPIAIGLIASMASSALLAAVFSVTHNADGGAGSLRQAILDANALTNVGAVMCPMHTIEFAMPGAGPHTIRPLTSLPLVSIPLHIDGYTQPGAIPNTLVRGTNALLKIELDGSFAGAVDGLSFGRASQTLPGCSGSSSRVSGLAINRFQQAGIRVQSVCLPPPNPCGLGGVSIVGSFIGTDVTGMAGLGNGSGVIFGPSTTVNVIGNRTFANGGLFDPIPEFRNLISGNTLDAVHAFSSAGQLESLRHTVRGNIIGLNALGTAAIGNGGHGVFAETGSDDLFVHENLISANGGEGVRIDTGGGKASLLGNGIGIGLDDNTFGNGGHGIYIGGLMTAVAVGGRFRTHVPGAASIRGNAGAGIYVADTALVDTVEASVGGNGGLGFDIAPLGVNANDPLDADAGPNQGLNYPVISVAERDPNTGGGIVSGSLNSNPGETVQITAYVSDLCDPSGFGEAQDIQAFVLASVTPDASGQASFSSNQVFLPLGKFITAQSRRFASEPAPTSRLIVSELSACVQISGLGEFFKNGFE